MDPTKTHSVMNKIGVFLLSGCSILLPIKPLVLIVVSMVMLDTIFGVWACIKIEGTKEFRSGKLWNICPKVFLYSVTILLSFLMDKYILGGELFSIPFLLAKSISVLWIAVEVISINENSMKMGNKSIMLIIRDLLNGIKDFKRDINEIKK
jgi:phage-related holin